MMRYIFLLVIFFGACKSSPDTPCEVLSFDEADYSLVKSLKDDLGNKYSELYINKKTPSLELKMFYWENGKQQSIVFLSKGKKTGPSMLFDSTGALIYEGFYFQDKEMGVVIQYDSYGKKAIIKTYKEGDLLKQQEVK